MTPEQLELLEDKARLWRRASKEGSMELRDYNLRAAVALETLMDEASERLEHLESLVDLFQHADENPVERFERLATMFRKDTGYLAPGKDQPMAGPVGPEGDELLAIYDAWYAGKISAVRGVVAKAHLS